MPHFLEKKTETTYFLSLIVKPNSRTQEIAVDAQKLIISVRSKPIKNKANKELIKLLRKKLNISNNQIELVSGMKNTEKIIKLTFNPTTDEETILNRLLS